MEKIYKGGLKIRDPQKSYWQAVLDMVKNSNEIKCISYESIYGYIFTVKVPDDKYEFFGLETDTSVDKKRMQTEGEENERFGNKTLAEDLISSIKNPENNAVTENTEKKLNDLKNFSLKTLNMQVKDTGYEEINYTRPVNIILLKIAILTPDKNVRYTSNLASKLPNEKIEKLTTKIDINNPKNDEFVKENIDQYLVYKNTLETNNKPICPSIFGSEMLDLSGGKEFLNNIIKDPYNIDPNVKNIIEKDLYTNFTEDDMKLGVIAMEYAEEFKLYDSFYGKETPELFASIFTNMIRLLISSKIIHCDLHIKNIMVKQDKKDKSKYETLLIDFGRCLNVDELNKNKYYIDLNNAFENVKITHVLGNSLNKLGNEKEFLKEYLFNTNNNNEIYVKIMKLILIILHGESLYNYKIFRKYRYQSFDLLQSFGFIIKKKDNKLEEIKNINQILKLEDNFDDFKGVVKALIDNKEQSNVMKRIHLIAVKLAEICSIKLTDKEMIMPETNVNRIGNDTNVAEGYKPNLFNSNIFNFFNKKGGKTRNTKKSKKSKSKKNKTVSRRKMITK